MAALYSCLEKPLLKCLKAQAKCIHAMAPKVVDEIAGVDCKGDPGAAKEMKIDEVELMHRKPPLYAPYTGPSLLVETGEIVGATDVHGEHGDSEDGEWGIDEGSMTRVSIDLGDGSSSEDDDLEEIDDLHPAVLQGFVACESDPRAHIRTLINTNEI